jgi:hypothetical protein
MFAERVRLEHTSATAVSNSSKNNTTNCERCAEYQSLKERNTILESQQNALQERVETLMKELETTRINLEMSEQQY